MYSYSTHADLAARLIAATHQNCFGAALSPSFLLERGSRRCAGYLTSSTCIRNSLLYKRSSQSSCWRMKITVRAGRYSKEMRDMRRRNDQSMELLPFEVRHCLLHHPPENAKTAALLALSPALEPFRTRRTRPRPWIHRNRPASTQLASASQMTSASPT